MSPFKYVIVFSISVYVCACMWMAFHVVCLLPICLSFPLVPSPTSCCPAPGRAIISYNLLQGTAQTTQNNWTTLNLPALQLTFIKVELLDQNISFYFHHKIYILQSKWKTYVWFPSLAVICWPAHISPEPPWHIHQFSTVSLQCSSPTPATADQHTGALW